MPARGTEWIPETQWRESTKSPRLPCGFPKRSGGNPHDRREGCASPATAMGAEHRGSPLTDVREVVLVGAGGHNEVPAFGEMTAGLGNVSRSDLLPQPSPEGGHEVVTVST